MHSFRRYRLGAVALVLTALLLGCSSEDDPGPSSTTGGEAVPEGEATTPTEPAQVSSPPSASPSQSAEPSTPPEPVVDTIPDGVRQRYLSEPYTPQTRQWQPRVGDAADGMLTVRQRRVPACDNDEDSVRAMGTNLYRPLNVDRDVLDFGADVTTTSSGFLVARQLTLYPDAEAAARFARTWSDPGCFSYRGRSMAGRYATDGGPDRFMHVAAAADGAKARFIEGSFTNAKGVTYRYIDTISRSGNVVALTRVVKDDDRRRGLGVLPEKAKSADFVSEVQKQAAESVDMINKLVR